MNKKLITAIMAATLSITSINMVQANEPAPATVAILDTALDTSLPQFQGKIVQEVCILEWNSCPNGSNFMEGPGAAVMPAALISKNGFDHGTKMAHTSILTNPNIKIVFVRIIGATSTGTRQVTNEPTFVNALNWVLANKSKYNIQAVAMSQGHHNLGSGANYCPSTPQTESAINSLVSASVPVFLPAGNNRDLTRISWPACITSAVSVSATAYGDGAAIYTNFDKNKTDYFAMGSIQVVTPGGRIVNEAGTSVSTQIAAALYMNLRVKNPSYTYTQMISLLDSKSVQTTGRRAVAKGKLLSAEVILRG
jgi:subtilisin